MTELTRELASFIAHTGIRDIPEQHIEKAKICILDCLGSALGGIDDEASEHIVRYVQRYGGTKRSSIWGADFAADPASAALANGVIAHALDFDDYHEETVIHATSVCLPALMALAEERHASGQDMLAALIVAIDVAIRLGQAFGSYHYELGWHSSSTAGRFGAVAGVCNLLKLKEEEIINALGICGTQAGGVRQVFGTMSKPLNVGKAAMDGVISALLAEDGFTSSKHIIEGELGMLSVFTEHAQADEVLQGLGSTWYIDQISLKPYPTCA
jgi:2-methylcitrate dehydratase PrpD